MSLPTADFLRACVQKGMSDDAIGREFTQTVAPIAHGLVGKLRHRFGIPSARQLGTTQTPRAYTYDPWPRQKADWPALPADAFRNARTHDYGGRLQAGSAGVLGLGEWTC